MNQAISATPVRISGTASSLAKMHAAKSELISSIEILRSILGPVLLPDQVCGECSGEEKATGSQLAAELEDFAADVCQMNRMVLGIINRLGV